MPFTPFHFGPGLLFKGLASPWFSMTTFAATQVVIDCETLYFIMRHESPLHRTLHTFVGATAVGCATAAVVLGVRACLRRLSRGGYDLSGFDRPTLRSELSTIGIVTGGIIGGLTHPLLDGLMHRDIRPFLPWTEANPLQGAVELTALHAGCVLAGLSGLMLVANSWYWDGRAR